MLNHNKLEAFLLIGGLTLISRRTAFIPVLEKLGLVILVLDEPKNFHSITQSEIMCDESLNEFLSRFHEVCLADTNETVKILQQVLSWQKKFSIQGVYCINELLVEISSLIADYLKLPSPGLRAGRVTRDKYLQRMYLSRWSPCWSILPPGSHNPDFIDQSIKFPAIIKPTSRHSSSGILRVDSIEQLKVALHNYSDDETLLVENIVYGPEFSVESLLQDGNIIFESITEKTTTEKESLYFVEISHQVPALNLNENQRRLLLEANRAILNSLNFKDGISHAEFRITSDQNVILMEIAARNPGDAILQLYYLATGYLIEEAIINIALGCDACYPAPNRIAKQVYLPHVEGILCEIEIKSLDEIPNIVWLPKCVYLAPIVPGDENRPPSIRQVQALKCIGETLGEVSSSSDRAVSFIMDALTLEQLANLELKGQQAISVITEVTESA